MRGISTQILSLKFQLHYIINTMYLDKEHLHTLLSTLLKRTKGVMPSGGFENPSAISMSFSKEASLFVCNHRSRATTYKNWS